MIFFRDKIKDPIVLTDVVLTGKRFTAEECLASGLVQEICSAESLIDTAVEAGRKALGGRSINRDAMHMMKMDLYEDILDALMLKKLPSTNEKYDLLLSQLTRISKL